MNDTSVERAAAAGRHYGMDWLRIGAFQLLILYHVGMAFVAWPYEVKVAAAQDWYAVPMLLTNPWRLSLLFLVSGYASAALFRRRPMVGPFIRERLARLGLPLLFGIVVVVTPQPWVALVTQHGYPHGFGHFLLHDYYRFQFIDGIAMPTWMHLWFVVYLLAYTLVLGALLSLPDQVRATLRQAAQQALSGPLLLIVPPVWVAISRLTLPPGWIDTHRFVDDWSAHATYLPMFLFGYLLRGSPALQTGIARWWKPAGTAALLAYAGMAITEIHYPGTTPLPDGLRPYYNALKVTEMWGAIVGLVGLADRHWNVDGRWRTMLAEAVFPFYLVHQTIILVVGYWLIPTETGALARFIILVTATAGGCWLFYLGGREIGWLRPLIGLKRQARPAPVTHARAAA